MAESTLIKKLGIKPGYSVLVVNAPEGYRQLLGELPAGVEVEAKAAGQYNVVQLFVNSKAEVDRFGPKVIQVVKSGGLLWLTYPKKSTKIKTDVTRDTGWESLWDAGWTGIAIVAVDEMWSALRFRPSAEIGSRKK